MPPTRVGGLALLDGESLLWQRMSYADRRHSIAVARRFVDRWRPVARDEIAGALLHDVGKLDCWPRHLRPCGRDGRRLRAPPRFRRYHDHEQIGADLLAAAGSSDVTVELVRRPRSGGIGASPGRPDLRRDSSAGHEADRRVRPVESGRGN